ncbi:hypothetical protein XFF6992_460007 [Xanthomonas citri pv. fuscans]|nr:hypothetical protein XFF6992_460007 [Xanthomonas citri pv. fuscans]
MHFAGIGRRHLRPQDSRHRQRGAVRVVPLGFLVPVGPLDRQHNLGRALRWGWNRPHNNFNPMIGLNNAFGDMLLNFVTGRCS